MIPLIAQAENSIWHNVIQALSMNGIWVFIAICVLAGTTKHIIKMILIHRERIAMIESGITPDQKKSNQFKDTIDYVEKESE